MLKKLTIAQLFYSLIGVSIVAIVGYLIFSGAKLKTLINNERNAISLQHAYRASEELSFLYNKAAVDFSNNQIYINQTLSALEKYLQLNSRNAPLKPIKKTIQSLHKEFDIEICLIDKNFVVFQTTFGQDLHLDFKQLPSALKDVKFTYENPDHIDISPIVNDAINNRFKKYVLKKMPNKDYMIQIAYSLKKLPKVDFFESSIFDFENLLTYNLVYLFNAKSSNNLPEVQLHWAHNLEKFLKKDVIDVHMKEGNKLIASIARQNNIKFSFEDIKKHFDTNLFLEVRENIDNKQIYTVLLRFKNAIYSQQPDKLTLLLLQFDETAKYNDIQKLDIVLYTLWLVIFLIIVVAIYLINNRFIQPITELESSMMQKQSLSNIHKYDYSDEITNIMRKYNNLLRDLNIEIKTNEELLGQFKEFAGNTIHQIRTPISVIKIALEMIDTKNEEEKLQIESSLLNMEHMYNSLAYTLQQEEIQFKSETINLSKLLQERIEIFNIIAKAHDKTVITHIDDNIYTHLNPIEAEYLIDNNLSNAIKYSFAHSTIIVKLTMHHSQIALSFESAGEKIKNKEVLFERFAREHKDRKGSGIGLHMVHKICMQSNIIIDLTSKEQKNTFTYYFQNVTHM